MAQPQDHTPICIMGCVVRALRPAVFQASIHIKFVKRFDDGIVTRSSPVRVGRRSADIADTSQTLSVCFLQ